MKEGEAEGGRDRRQTWTDTGGEKGWEGEDGQGLRGQWREREQEEQIGEGTRSGGNV